MKRPPRKRPHKEVKHVSEKRACSTQKVGYRTRKLALTKANMTLHFLGEIGKNPPERLFAYKCDRCGDYHLTRRGR